MSTIKRLFWDIETSPNVVLSWRVGYDLKIDHDNILKERAIICIGYKWEGDKKARVLKWDDNQCDKAMLRKFLKVAARADEMVAHNGDRFDLTWFKTRCIFHGLPTLPEYKTIDTLQWARKKFLFNSNKLDYIAKYLGIGGKIKTEFGLWKDVVLERDAAALRRMTTYCARDVELLEKVWERLRKHTKHKTHVGVIQGKGAWSCPHCGSNNVHRNNRTVSASGGIKNMMYCKDCGGWYSVSDAVYKAFLEAKKKAA